MRAPSIFIAIRTTGDGYGHNSITYLSWHFDEDEARKAAEAACDESGRGGWASVEEVEAVEKQEKSRW